MLVVAFLVVQVIALDDEVSNEVFVGEMRPRVLATAKIMREGEPLATTNIFGIPYLTEPSTTTIARLDRHGELPKLDVSADDVLTAREYVQTVIGDASKYPEGVVTSVLVSGGTPTADAPGCVAISPTAPGTRPVVLLHLPSSGSFRVATDRPAAASLSFVDGDARAGNHASSRPSPTAASAWVSRARQASSSPCRAPPPRCAAWVPRAFGSADHDDGRLRPWLNATSCSTTTRR